MSAKTPLDSSRAIIPAGTRLNSIYEIDEPLATGGMGEVYRGHAIQTGDPVAIKLIRSDLDEAEAAFALFRKEAAALHNLYHEAIVRYYVFTIDPVLERPYLAMEFVDGKSLSAILRKGPLSCEAVHSLMVRIASGLHAAHIQGIVHRDISPDNIIVPGGEMARAKIIDFGIARSTRRDSGGTIIGSGFAGKYNYVSPEQLGLFGGDVTPRSDIYSLGLVLAEALRQKPLNMSGSPADVIEKRRKLPDLTGIDSRLRPLIERMLQPHPKDRPQSMAEVAAWSFAARANVTVTKQPVGFAQTVVALDKTDTTRTAPEGTPLTWGRKRPRRWSAVLLTAIGAALAVAIGVGFVGYFFYPRPLKPEEIIRYVKQYSGGPCFYVKPQQVTDKSAVLLGYGVTNAPFWRLDTAFRDKVGFEAEIDMHEVAAPQCAALEMLGHLQLTQLTPPKIALASTSLKLGENLVGMIDGIEGRQVNLLLVADDGSVRLLSETSFPPKEEKMAFNAKLGPELANGKLQLLVAIASPKPIAAFPKDVATAAEKLFPQLMGAAKSAGLGLAAGVRSFKLEK